MPAESIARSWLHFHTDSQRRSGRSVVRHDAAPHCRYPRPDGAASRADFVPPPVCARVQAKELHTRSSALVIPSSTPSWTPPRSAGAASSSTARSRWTNAPPASTSACCSPWSTSSVAPVPRTTARGRPPGAPGATHGPTRPGSADPGTAAVRHRRPRGRAHGTDRHHDRADVYEWFDADIGWLMDTAAKWLSG